MIKHSICNLRGIAYKEAELDSRHILNEKQVKIAAITNQKRNLRVLWKEIITY
jgi:hypothetical protein